MVAMMGVPILSIFIAPAAAAGLLLPMYILADVYAVWLFRGHYSARNLKILIPAAAIGIFVAFLLISRVPVEATKLVVALIGLGYLADALRKRLAGDFAARPADVPRGLVWGTLAGLTSYISHAGGAPYQAYVLPQKLDKLVYLGTTTIFFTIVNLLKVPPYVLADQINAATLSRGLWLAPFALLGAWSGATVSRMLPEKVFFLLVEIALALVSFKLIAEVLFT